MISFHENYLLFLVATRIVGTRVLSGNRAVLEKKTTFDAFLFGKFSICFDDLNRNFKFKSISNQYNPYYILCTKIKSNMSVLFI